jgi:hypothetical protein
MLVPNGMPIPQAVVIPVVGSGAVDDQRKHPARVVTIHVLENKWLGYLLIATYNFMKPWKSS